VSSLHHDCGQGSSVGIATGYGLDGPGIESWWGLIFHTCPDRTWSPPAFCTICIGSFPGIKSVRGVTLTPHALPVPWSKKSTGITLLPLRAIRSVQGLSACTVELYIYSPYGPYGLYRASVPVQYSYTSTPLRACRI